MAAIPDPMRATPRVIDEWHETHRERPRPHLGASLLGIKCDRRLWLSFRWALPENFNGRMLRLFRRGQREEEMFVKDLRRIGVNIHSTCLDGDGQSRVDFGCHVSGNVDGIIESGLPEAPKTRHIAEFKTHNAASFSELQKEGVAKAKPQHWAQMQIYMLGTGIERAFYMAVNKDNDELYSERIEFNKPVAEALVNRGHRIVLAERMPEPMPNASPTWFECKMCPCHEFCWETHLSTCINCRTCSHVTPLKNSTWVCSLCGREETLSYEMQLHEQGEGPCEAHVFHPDLVPWLFKGGNKSGSCACYEIDGKIIFNGFDINEPESLTSREILAGIREPPYREIYCEKEECPF